MEDVGMKVVLLEDVRGTGLKDQLVDVARGFAKNFLFPLKKAKLADTGALKDLENKKEAMEHRHKLEEITAKKVAAVIDKIEVTVYAKPGKEGKIFGSVTAKEICSKLSEQYSVDVDKRKISLDQEIKAFGRYRCEIKIYAGIVAEIFVIVTEELPG
jgi:large subunit ribosomal protein L9